MGKKKQKQPPTPSPAALPARDTRYVAANREADFAWMSPVIYAVLFLTTLLVYAPVLRFDFVNFDDPDYVTRNAHVLRGITAEGVSWAFTSGEAANWFPVTRLSHMLDYQLFGLNGGLHHLTSVLFHALATLLLFAFLHRATGAWGGELRLDGAGVSGGELRLDGAGARWPSAF